jgi:hypothetical protein
VIAPSETSEARQSCGQSRAGQFEKCVTVAHPSADRRDQPVSVWVHARRHPVAHRVRPVTIGPALQAPSRVEVRKSGGRWSPSPSRPFTTVQRGAGCRVAYQAHGVAPAGGKDAVVATCDIDLVDTGPPLVGVHAGSVAKIGLTVTIPSAGSGPQGPTGQVNNPTTGFVVGGTNTSPAAFIFASLNGTISAWNGGAGTTAVIEATVAGASFTGLAIDRTTQQIYAANDKQGTINVFGSTFNPVPLPLGAFVVPGLPAGLVLLSSPAAAARLRAPARLLASTRPITAVLNPATILGR